MDGVQMVKMGLLPCRDIGETSLDLLFCITLSGLSGVTSVRKHQENSIVSFTLTYLRWNPDVFSHVSYKGKFRSTIEKTFFSRTRHIPPSITGQTRLLVTNVTFDHCHVEALGTDEKHKDDPESPASFWCKGEE